MTSIENRIEQVVDSILEDYRSGRDIDRLERLQCPDRDVIIDIIEKLRRIIFPGYFRDKNYKYYNAKSNLSVLIEDVMFHLTFQMKLVYQSLGEEETAATERAQEVCLAFLAGFLRSVPWCRLICRQLMTVTRQLRIWQRSSSPIPVFLPLRSIALPTNCIV